MSSYCLDTSAYSSFRRGNEEVAPILAGPRAGGVGGRQRRDEDELDVFLNNSVVQVTSVDAETSQYAEMVAELPKAGTPNPPPTTSGSLPPKLATAPTVLTFDDHFEHIWRVGAVVYA